MISKQQLIHKVQIIVAVTDVSIEIRFPCKLQVGIKIGKDETNGNQEVELKAGQASFIESITVQTNMPYDASLKRYAEKKASITVFVISPRGKNVAGVLSIDLATLLNKTPQETTITREKLERCPDKDATINFKIKGVMLEELRESNVSLASDRSAVYTPMGGREFGILGEARSEAKYGSSSRLGQGPEKKLERLDRTPSQHHNKKSIVEEIGSSINTVEYVRSEALIKGKREDGTVINENFKLKSRIDELEREVESLNREVVEKKRLQKEEETLNFRVAELQRVISSNRLELDNFTKEKKRDTSELSNRVEELEKLNATLQKRVDVKSNFYKDELEKYNTKLLSAEGEKQQLIQQISSLKDENFDLTRKGNSLRDREKLLNEDKLKLTKRIEELKRQHSEKESVVDQSGKDIVYQRLKQTISNNELQKLSLLDELQKLKNQVVSEGMFRSKYEQEMKDKNNIIQQKMYQENQHLIKEEENRAAVGKLHKQLADRAEEISSLNNRLLEANNRHKLEAGRLAEEADTVKSTLEFVKHTEEKGRADYEDLSLTLQECQRHLNESQRRSANQDQALREVRSDNEQLKKNIKVYNEEVRALKGEIQKLNSVVGEFESQLTLETDSKRNNEKEYKLSIERLESTNKQSHKELLQLHQELESLKAHAAQHDIDYNDQLDKKQRTIREKDQELRMVYEEETNLQMTNAQLESKSAELRETLRVTESELNKERTQGESLRKANLHLQEEETSLRSALNEMSNNYEERTAEAELLNEQKHNLEVALTTSRKDLDKYKQDSGEHINALLKSLVTKSKTEGPAPIQGLSEGLLKLETDVINKIKNCYEELEVVAQKLASKEMDSIHLAQSADLQIQTLQIELGQAKKQLLSANEDKASLGSDLETTKHSLVMENENLKEEMKLFEIQLSEQLSNKIKESSDKYDKESLRWREQTSKEKEQYDQKVAQLENLLANTQKELYEQYNQVNVMNSKVYENAEFIKELEYRMSENNGKENLFENERARLVGDILYLENELHRIGSLNEIIDRNLTLAVEREAILTEQNEYLRSQFQITKSSPSTNTPFQQREKAVIDIHRTTSENSKLLQQVQELQLILTQKDNRIKSLDDNIKALGEQIQDKYQTIYSLENNVIQTKSKFRDLSRNNISLTSEEGQVILMVGLEAKIRELMAAINALISGLSGESEGQLRAVYEQVEELLRMVTSRDQQVKPNLATL